MWISFGLPSLLSTVHLPEWLDPLSSPALSLWSIVFSCSLSLSVLLQHLIILSFEVLLSLLLFMLQSLCYPLHLATCPACVMSAIGLGWSLLHSLICSLHLSYFFHFHKCLLLLCLLDGAASVWALFTQSCVRSNRQRAEYWKQWKCLEEFSIKARWDTRNHVSNLSEPSEELEPVLETEQSQEEMCGLIMKITKMYSLFWLPIMGQVLSILVLNPLRQIYFFLSSFCRRGNGSPKRFNS